MTVSTSEARHLLFRLSQPATLPGALLGVLRDEIVLAGWLRASGVLSDVQIKGGMPYGDGASPRRIAGPVHVVMLEGSIGLAAGDVSCGMRVVLARETEAGEVETIAGDLVDARIGALEVHVTAFDDVVATRQLDSSGVWLLDATSATTNATSGNAPTARNELNAGQPIARTSPAPSPNMSAPVALSPNAPSALAPRPSGFGDAVRANEAQAPRPVTPQTPVAPLVTPAARPSPTFSNQNAMPTRIAKPARPEEEDQAIPEPGDVVEHFAFGRCEVVKTDGDRLHVRLPKDQRVKEIALEMLRVSILTPEEGQTSKHWMLSRKL